MARRVPTIVFTLLAVTAVMWVARASRPQPLTVAAPLAAAPPYVTVSDTLGPNQTLSELFGRHGIYGNDLFELLDAARGEIDPRRVRAGDVFTLRVRTEGPADRVQHRIDRNRRLVLSRRGDGWAREIEEIAWDVQRFRVSGSVEGGSNLWVALVRALPEGFLGDDERFLADEVERIYDWVIEFQLDVHPGDRFSLVAERLVSSEGEIRFNRVLAAQIESMGRPMHAYGLPGNDGRLDFFDDQERSLKRMFLKTPVRQTRITSGFGRRRHPILGGIRNHNGVDYRAARGEEVRATGDGVVTFAGRDGGFGNIVRVRHARGFQTWYAHLQGFARGIRRNARVSQGQIIGYVGSTGLATAPHAHYEFHRNGRPVNPRAVDLGDGVPLPRDRRSEFTTLVGQFSRLVELPDPASANRSRVADD